MVASCQAGRGKGYRVETPTYMCMGIGVLETSVSTKYCNAFFIFYSINQLSHTEHSRKSEGERVKFIKEEFSRFHRL